MDRTEIDRLLAQAIDGNDADMVRGSIGNGARLSEMHAELLAAVKRGDILTVMAAFDAAGWGTKVRRPNPEVGGRLRAYDKSCEGGFGWPGLACLDRQSAPEMVGAVALAAETGNDELFGEAFRLCPLPASATLELLVGAALGGNERILGRLLEHTGLRPATAPTGQARRPGALEMAVAGIVPRYNRGTGTVRWAGLEFAGRGFRALRTPAAYSASTSAMALGNALHAALLAGHDGCVEVLAAAMGPGLLERIAYDVRHLPAAEDVAPALHLAARHGRPESVRALLRHGAGLGASKCGNTPLHFAMYGLYDAASRAGDAPAFTTNAYISCATCLLDAGVDLRARNGANHSAFDIISGSHETRTDCASARRMREFLLQRGGAKAGRPAHEREM